MILNVARWLAYLLLLASPNAWIMPFFQKKYGDKYYTNPTATELYHIVATAYPVAIMSIDSIIRKTPPFCTWLSIALAFCAWLSIPLVTECIQYQLWHVVIRPAFDSDYKRFSNPRTLMIIILQYFEVIFVFALIYNKLFAMQFYIAQHVGLSSLSPIQAIEFSAVTMTTLGYGSVYPVPGSVAGGATACEALCGVFFLALMLGIVISGLRQVGEVGERSS
jgi:hypothetical protein